MTQTEQNSSILTSKVHTSSEHTTTQIQLEHSYAMNMRLKVKDVFKCPVCDYDTSIRSRFMRHRSENCNVEPKKTIPCPICRKMYTHNTLRDHLRNYTAANRVFRGEHRKYSPHYHSELLTKISKK